MNKVFASALVEVIDPGVAHTFVVNGEKLRSYGKSEKTLEKASHMLVEP